LKDYPDDALETAFRIYWRDGETKIILGKMIEIINPELDSKKALPEMGRLTDEQREANKKRFKELLASIKVKGI
jgi:Ca2+-binding EF-hand superfamily protein